METKMKKGLSSSMLKYIALVAMILDHLHYFFEFTGKIPMWFTYVGRLAAPLFLFCLIEGWKHTHDKRKYFLKIYIIGAVMGLLQFGFYNVFAMLGLVRGDGFFPQNAMLSSFTILMVVLAGIDCLREKKIFKGLVLTFGPILLPYIVMAGIYAPLTAGNHSLALFFANMINMSILPLHTSILDGGTLTLIQGIAMYIFSKKRNGAKVLAYAVSTALYYGCMMVLIGDFPTVETLFTTYYELFELFSVVPMLLYNGEKGNGNRKLFYWFYPAHIYVLYALSFVLYNVMK